MEFTIREELPTDNNAIYEINKNAFETSEEAELVNRLRNSESFVPELSLVAQADDTVIGHILFTKIKITSTNGKVYASLALAPMAVLNKCQNLGIGSELVKKGMDKATALGFDSVIVLGHENYYPRFGFKPASKFNIQAPFDVPDSAFMAIELKAGSLQLANGVVSYSKEFEDL